VSIPVPPSLEETLRENLEARVDLIVHTNGPAVARRQQAEMLGLKVRHVFHLTNCLAVTGPARAALALADADWVDRIEQDQEMRTMVKEDSRART